MDRLYTLENRRDDLQWLAYRTDNESCHLVNFIDIANAKAGFVGNISLKANGSHHSFTADEFISFARSRYNEDGDWTGTDNEYVAVYQGVVSLSLDTNDDECQSQQYCKSAVIAISAERPMYRKAESNYSRFLDVLEANGFLCTSNLIIGFVDRGLLEECSKLIASIVDVLDALGYGPSVLESIDMRRINVANIDGAVSYLTEASCPINAKAISRYVLAFKKAKYNAEIADMMVGNGRRKDEKPEFLVDGMIPRGVVTAVIATKGAGKTMAMHQLAVRGARLQDGASEHEEWLGIPLRKEAFRGVSILMAGEDDQPTLDAREARMDPDEGAISKIAASYLGLPRVPIAERLAKYEDIGGPIDMIVIDTVRAFHMDSLNDSTDVAAFFEPLEAFARRHKCAVVVTMHVNKASIGDELPKHPVHVMNAAVGSGLFTQRPRVNIAMFLDVAKDVVHIGTGTGMHNQDATLMVEGWREFKRNADTLDFEPVQQ